MIQEGVDGLDVPDFGGQWHPLSYVSRAEPAPPVHPSEALCWPGSRYIVYRGSMVIVTCEKLQALKFRDGSITSEWCRAGK